MTGSTDGNYERRKRYREHHDKMKEVEQELAFILAQSRLGICHTTKQIRAGAKLITHMIEQTERELYQEYRRRNENA